MKGKTMRNNLRQFIVGGALTLLLAALVPGAAYSQDSSQNDPNKSQSQTQPKASAQATSQSSATSVNDSSYSVSLADGQAIPLGADAQAAQLGLQGQAPAGQAARTQLFYGGDISAVYIDNYTPTSIENSTSGVVSPYVGLYVPTRTGGMTLQYRGTFTPDNAFTGDFESYHALAFNAAGAFTHRLYWGLASSAEYGSEAARFEGPLTYLLVGLTPVVNPVASGALLQGRNTAFAQNLAKLGWRMTARDRFELSGYHTYTDLSSSPVFGLAGDRSNAVGTKLDYAHDVTPRFRFHLYGDAEHVMESNCNTYGGGVGIQARLSYSWYLDVSGGPQFTSANCGDQQNANFYGALVKNLRGNSKFYIVGWRTFSTSFQTASRWQDSVAAGLLYPIRRFTLQGDAGYFKGNPLFVTTQPIQGYFVAPLIRYSLTEHTAVSAGYRIFHATGGNTVPGSLQYAVVSLEWRPAPVRVR
jgi:hypothetical protein